MGPPYFQHNIGEASARTIMNKYLDEQPLDYSQLPSNIQRKSATSMGFNAIAPSDVPQIDDHFPAGQELDAADDGGTPRDFVDNDSPKIKDRKLPLKKAQYYEPPPEDRDAS